MMPRVLVPALLLLALVGCGEESRGDASCPDDWIAVYRSGVLIACEKSSAALRSPEAIHLTDCLNERAYLSYQAVEVRPDWLSPELVEEHEERCGEVLGLEDTE